MNDMNNQVLLFADTYITKSWAKIYPSTEQTLTTVSVLCTTSLLYRVGLVQVILDLIMS